MGWLTDLTNGVGDVALSLTGTLQSRGARKAAELQRQGQLEARALQEKNLAKTEQDLDPYRQVGLNALKDYGAAAYDNYAPEAPTQSNFNFRDFSSADLENDAGYKFRKAAGEKALMNSRASQGLLNSGATLKALADYGQGMASNEFNNAYNRYQGDRNFAQQNFAQDRMYNNNNRQQYFQDRNAQSRERFARLAQLAGMGQTATNTLGSFRSGYSGDIGRATTSAADASASGVIGATNAKTDAFSRGIDALSGVASRIAGGR